MSDDIVTRLRKPLPYNLVGLTTKDLGNERYEAADEIERLRAERDKFYHLARRLYNQHGRRGDEVLAEAYLLKEYEKAVEF